MNGSEGENDRAISPISIASVGSNDSWTLINGALNIYSSVADMDTITSPRLIHELSKPGLIKIDNDNGIATNGNFDADVDIDYKRVFTEKDADMVELLESKILDTITNSSVRLPLIVASNVLILAVGILLGRKSISFDIFLFS